MSTGSQKKFQKFAEFLEEFVRELNSLSSEGAVVLVEGKRDVGALRALGYRGAVITLSTMRTASGQLLVEGASLVVVLTDLDSEGRHLAARCIKELSRRSARTSLAQRTRLAVASKGVFLHVENLGRFAPLITNVCSD